MLKQINAVIPIKTDFFIGNQYWKFEANVEVCNHEIYDTKIVSIEGVDGDDMDIPLSEPIEDYAKEIAESIASEKIGDCLSNYSNFIIEDEE